MDDNSTRTQATHDPAAVYPAFTDFLPDVVCKDSRYRMRFAQNESDLDAVFKLRFCVFNVELDEGFSESYMTGRDRDEYDWHCHHILVECIETGEVVGTYRLQIGEMAEQGSGWYTDSEFDLAAMPARVIESAIEAGRACISRPHRNRQVLFLLWKGLAAYFKCNRKRYFFGCCSLTSQNPQEGMRVLGWLRANGHMHPKVVVPPRAGFECTGGEAGDPTVVPEVKIPTLFGTYLRYGAKLCGPPAIDREFGTIDFLALLDVRRVNPKVLATLLK